MFILIAALTYLGLPAAHADSNGHLREAMLLPYLLIPVKAVLSWYVLRWVIEKITAQGQPLGLRFTGGVGGYIGWTLFLANNPIFYTVCMSIKNYWATKKSWT